MMSKNMQPFKGLRYDLSKAGDLSTLLAPPYDIISPQEQDDLYQKSDYNVIRLILGKQNESDTETDNRYTRSSIDLEKWINEGAVKRDETESVYIYAQTYTLEGDSKTRVGFIARKRLEDFGGSIIPHEKTLSGPKTDRLNLTRACRCNFSQIFGLFTDKEKRSDALLAEATTGKPDMEVTTGDGMSHRLWAVSDSEWIEKLATVIEGKPVLIADGHHRYETALNYYKEASASGNTSEDIKYVMMYFTNTESEGLTVLPTHRLVFNLDNFDLDSFLEKLKPDFDITNLPSPNGNRNADVESDLEKRLNDAKHKAFGLYAGNGKYSFLRYTGSSVSSPLDELDVGILHNKILEAHLGIGPEQLAKQSNVKYSQEIGKTAEKVDSEGFQLAFFLNPTPVAHMWKVTSAGLKMPQKSTYFFPKLISGLVFNPLF
jgi:uncharacterized protein (DUF1015 family)